MTPDGPVRHWIMKGHWPAWLNTSGLVLCKRCYRGRLTPVLQGVRL